jgi:hypothetical protein
MGYKPGKQLTEKTEKVKYRLTPSEAESELARLKEKLATGRSPNKSDGFPIISIMSKADMNTVLSHMQEDVLYAEQEQALKDAREEGRQALIPILDRYAEAVKAGGVRHGQLAVYYNPSPKPRRTLNKLLLIENGVKASVIEASMKASDKPVKPSVKVVDLSKPRPAWDGGDDGE